MAKNVTEASVGRSVVDYVYVASRGAHGIHHVGVFEAHVGSEREIWIGSDGSGMIREARGPVSFYTEAGKARWEAAGRPLLEHGPSAELFAPGCLGTRRAWQEKLPSDPDALWAALAKRPGWLTLKFVYGLLGEALYTPGFCRAAYEVAKRLPDVEVLPIVKDQLGRSGQGLAHEDEGHRLELVFTTDTAELLGQQWYLIDPSGYAPVGTLVSWTAYLARELHISLPPGTPPIPGPPCSPPGTGRGTQTAGGYTIMTG